MKTLLILGAGASKDYELPLGQELISKIEGYINNKRLLLPQRCDTFHQVISHFASLQLELCPYTDAIRPTFEDGYQSYYLERGNSDYYGKRLITLPDVRDFLEDLKMNEPVSIDKFLRNFENYSDIGKVLIFNVINFSQHEFSLKVTSNALGDHWYKYLANDIQDNLDVNTSIITFNYDTTLEEYLRKVYKKIKSIYKNLESFIDNNIIHVYGKIHSKDCSLNPSGRFKISDNFKCNIQDTNYLIHACKKYSNINLIRESYHDSKAKIDEIITRSQKIVFIGFGFDEINFQILFGSSANDGTYKIDKTELKEKLKNKKVILLNYKGQLNHAVSTFQEIMGKNDDEILNNCVKDNVRDFYINDARTFLLG